MGDKGDATINQGGATNNDQIIRTVPGTDVGGHDTAGTDGEVRTERPGQILGTPNPDGSTAKHTEDGRAKEALKHQTVVEAVDKANREVLPTLGGNLDDGWEADQAKATTSTTTLGRLGNVQAPARAATPAEEAAIARQKAAGH